MNDMKHFRGAPIQLSELDLTQQTAVPDQQEVEILRTGTFQDPRYGVFTITRAMLSEMVKNFADGVRGIELMIDFGHDTEGEAAGWIRTLTTRKDGDVLTGMVQWTQGGKRKLSDKAYAYLSADFNTSYRDNESGKQYGCVLLGAALTNRPVIKNMQSVVQLSEKQEGAKMKLQLADIQQSDVEKLNSLMEQYQATSIEDLMAKIAAANTAKPEMAAMEAKLSEATTKVSTVETELKQLKEENATLKTEKETAEKSKTFDRMLSEGKACEAQRESFLKGDLIKFAELAPVGGVKTTEVGTEEGSNAQEEDEQDKIIKLAEVKVEKKEAKDMAEAISMVLREQKESANK